jgi:hypothetical protein
MTDTTKQDGLKNVGRNAMAALREMVAALECDYDRLEELRDEWKDHQEAIIDLTKQRDDALKGDADREELLALNNELLSAMDNVQAWQDENMTELAELEEAAGECESRDDAETRIQEDPLSIEYRSGWVSDKSDMVPEEACILLTTGGPAVRIIVELDDGQPHRAYMQVQDWGTPWTDYHEDGIDDVLMTYVSCFCFE